MAKQVFDRSTALLGLLVLSPVLLLVGLLVWLQDFKSPLYMAPRAARRGGTFRIVKIRSMMANADRTGASSSGVDDVRITPLGRFIRRWKIDELSQLWNVLKGDMSLVGPRPQVLSEVASYTAQERDLLLVKPGITDFSSIVFADENEILAGAPDADLAYRQLIRPWKSRLGLFYVAHRSFVIDLKLIYLTLARIASPNRTLASVTRLLEDLGASEELLLVARRTKPLKPAAVPGRLEPFEQ